MSSMFSAQHRPFSNDDDTILRTVALLLLSTGPIRYIKRVFQSNQYPSISQGDGELDLHEADTGLREIILRRVSSTADGDDDGAG